jgi:hypothetical protein
MEEGEREREREAGGAQYPLQGHMPHDLTSFHWALPPKDSTTSQWHHRLATKPLTYSLWGTIQIQTRAPLSPAMWCPVLPLDHASI